MSYTREITRSKERGYETLFKRTYTVHFIEPPKERAAAIEALSAKGKLYPLHDYLAALDKLAEDAAQEFLRKNPILELFDSYFVHDRSFSDEDMNHLGLVPELTRLHLRSDEITDKGIENLEAFERLEALLLYASHVTDQCLGSIVKIQSLASLDLQGSPNISTAALSSYKSHAKLIELYEPSAL